MKMMPNLLIKYKHTKGVYLHLKHECAHVVKDGDCDVIKYVYFVALFMGCYTSHIALRTCSR